MKGTSARQRNVGTKVYGTDVYIYHKEWTASTFTKTAMIRDGTTWEKDLTGYYDRWTIIAYYIESGRADLPLPERREMKAYRPVYYNIYETSAGSVSTPPAEFCYLEIQ